MGDDARVLFKLFVMGTGPRSVRAIVNLRRLCERMLPGAYTLNVVDIAVHPAQARDNQLLAVPTLVVQGEGEQSQRRFVGDMSDERPIVEALQAFQGLPNTDG